MALNLYGEYEFEYVDPDQTEPEPAPTHPDPAEAARLYSQARVFHTRRFALMVGGGDDPEVTKWHGLQFGNGRVVIWHSTSQLVGSYRSVDSARRRLAKDKHDLYLVWLEPKPSINGPEGTTHNGAVRERRRNAPKQWCVTAGFTAFGPHGARLMAMDVAKALADMLPGFDRADLAIACADDLSVVLPVFCQRNEYCAKTPGHFPPCLDVNYARLEDAFPPNGDES